MKRAQTLRVLSKVTLNRQPTIWLYDPYLEVLTLNVNDLDLFLGKEFPLLTNYLCRASDIAAVGTSFNVFSSDWRERIPYVLSHGRRLKGTLGGWIERKKIKNIVADIVI